jgi:hypothetical protein
MLSDLTPDQKALADAMSGVSEAAYSASWMTGLEFALWGLLASGETRYGRATLKKEEVENIRRLSEKCGGWIVFDDEREEVFVLLADWKRIRPGIIYAQHGPVIQKRRPARPAGVADLNRWADKARESSPLNHPIPTGLRGLLLLAVLGLGFGHRSGRPAAP